jgi:hypothetical protein
MRGYWYLAAFAFVVGLLATPFLLPSSESVMQKPAVEVEQAANGLRIRWNEAIRSIAGEGVVLQIDDGGEQKRIRLSPDELRNGGMYYHPNSPDVRVQMMGGPSHSLATFRWMDGAHKAPVPFEQQTSFFLPGTEAPMIETTSIRVRVPLTVPVKPKRVFRPPVLLAVARPPSPSASFEPPPLAPAQTTAPVLVPWQLPELLPPPPPRELPVAGSSEPQTEARLFVPPRPVHQVHPNWIEATRLAREGNHQLRVIVRVSDKGRVTGVEIPPGQIELSLQTHQQVYDAARQWRFEPAKLRGQAVASEHAIVFAFKQ